MEGFRAGKRQKLLMWLDGCKIGLTVESEEGEVPHLRWSQAPPLPWPRPGSADFKKIVHSETLVGSPVFQEQVVQSETLVGSPFFCKKIIHSETWLDITFFYL